MLPSGYMSEHSHVVVAFDFSHSAHAALERAIGIAARAPWHVLHVVCAIHPRVPFPALPADRIDIAYADRVQEAASEEIAALLDTVPLAEPVHYFVHARIGRKPADEILGVAEDVGADLIVIGSKGLTGLERVMLGSTSERVVREAGCTVEVARPRRYAYKPLLEIVEHQADRHYVPPHRYHYDERRVDHRPEHWPLY
jgi:nucleotide-binding universal stress UspA family protein